MKRIRKIAVRLALAFVTLGAVASVAGAFAVLPFDNIGAQSRLCSISVQAQPPFGLDDTNCAALFLFWTWNGMPCGCWETHKPPCELIDPYVGFSIPQTVAYGSFQGLRLHVSETDGIRTGMVWIPYWMLATALSAWPLVALARWMIRRKRRPPGGCRACGYDLTGNVSGRCPECGDSALS